MFVNKAEIKNFKGFSGFKVSLDFAELQNVLEGDNNQRKTSVIEALNYVFTGCDSTGSDRVDHLVSEGFDTMGVGIAFTVNGAIHVLSRVRKVGKSSSTDLKLDKKKIKQSDLEVLIGNTKHFLAAFNSSYLLGLPDDKARDLLMGFVKTVGDQAILNTLPQEQQNLLIGHSFKDIDKFQKAYRAELKLLGDRKSQLEGAIGVYDSTIAQQVPDELPSKAADLDALKITLAKVNAGDFDPVDSMALTSRKEAIAKQIESLLANRKQVPSMPETIQIEDQPEYQQLTCQKERTLAAKKDLPVLETDISKHYKYSGLKGLLLQLEQSKKELPVANTNIETMPEYSLLQQELAFLKGQKQPLPQKPEPDEALCVTCGQKLPKHLYDDLVKRYEQNLQKVNTHNKVVEDKIAKAQSKINDLPTVLETRNNEVVAAVNKHNAEIDQKIQQVNADIDGLANDLKKTYETELDEVTRHNAAVDAQILSIDKRIAGLKEKLLEAIQVGIKSAEEHNQLIENQVSEKKAELENIDVQLVEADLETKRRAANKPDVVQLQANIDELIAYEQKVSEASVTRKVLSQQITQAKTNKQAAMTQIAKTDAELVSKQALVKALTDFAEAKIKLQTEQLSTHLSKTSISLAKVVKETGETKPDFNILYDGKTFKNMSNSNRCRCFLELSEMIKKLTNINYPTAVDNAECITSMNVPTGQYFVAKVVEKKPLTLNGSIVSIPLPAALDSTNNVPGEAPQTEQEAS